MEINKHFLRMSEEARENIFQSLLELLKYDNLVRLFVSYLLHIQLRQSNSVPCVEESGGRRLPTFLSETSLTPTSNFQLCLL